MSCQENRPLDTIAIYNALIILNDYTPIDDILDYFNNGDLSNTFLFGLAGTLPSTVAKYFEQRGYRVVCCNTYEDYDCMDMVSTVADACILWYLYKEDGAMCGGHYFAYSRTGKKGSLGFLGHNEGRNGLVHFNYPSRYGADNGGILTICIAIYKVGEE